MSLELRPQTESILIREAAREGVSVDELLTRHFAPANHKNGAGSAPRRVSALGKYAHVSGGSQAFAREKQAEIEREDRAKQ